MRALILLFIGLFFGAGLGYLLSVPTDPHDHAGHDDDTHEHSVVTAWTGPEPTIGITLKDDVDGAHNLFVDVTGFSFTPQDVNTEAQQGTGHAHVYQDGVKITRIYSPWTHLEGLESGATLRVTLNANDHTAWGYNGMPIAAEFIVP